LSPGASQVQLFETLKCYCPTQRHDVLSPEILAEEILAEEILAEEILAEESKHCRNKSIQTK
jgi:hypothetical protein